MIFFLLIQFIHYNDEIYNDSEDWNRGDGSGKNSEKSERRRDEASRGEISAKRNPAFSQGISPSNTFNRISDKNRFNSSKYGSDQKFKSHN